MRTFSNNEKSRPRPARWSWLPWAALRCLWCGFGERRGVRGKCIAQNFSFWEFWPFLHLFHVILKNFYTFLSILIFSVCFIRIFEKDAKTPHQSAAFLLCIFFINTSWWTLTDLNRWPPARQAGALASWAKRPCFLLCHISSCLSSIFAV